MKKEEKQERITIKSMEERIISRRTIGDKISRTIASTIQNTISPASNKCRLSTFRKKEGKIENAFHLYK
jgi:hypothetical protein